MAVRQFRANIVAGGREVATQVIVTAEIIPPSGTVLGEWHGSFVVNGQSLAWMVGMPEFEFALANGERCRAFPRRVSFHNGLVEFRGAEAPCPSLST
jgi:hypothetical protein